MSTDLRGWVRAADAAFVDDGERVAVLALDALDPLGARVLTGSAAAIWRAVGVAGSEEAIAAAVAQDVGVDVATVMEDVRGFLRELEAQGLLVRN